MFKVLCIEDQVVAARTVARAVRRLGGEIVVAQTAEAGLSLLDESLTLIVSDLGLPGRLWSDWIVELCGRAPAIPIIVISGFAMFDERAACYKAGCTDFLAKPFETEEIGAMIAKHLPPSQ